MIHQKTLTEILNKYPDIEIDRSVIIDLTSFTNYKIYPIAISYEKCTCKNNDAEIINHCNFCGATDINLDSGVPSYDLYSTIYKTMDILSKRFSTVCFISNSIVPTDFVGSLNRTEYTYLYELLVRRNIIHISNQMVHTDDWFVKENKDKQTQDKVVHISIFSNDRDINSVFRNKIIHSSGLNPVEYLNMLLSSVGIVNNILVQD